MMVAEKVIMAHTRIFPDAKVAERKHLLHKQYKNDLPLSHGRIVIGDRKMTAVKTRATISIKDMSQTILVEDHVEIRHHVRTRLGMVIRMRLVAK
jgi:hypothetical protein